jgi:hypothetical protein
MDRRLNNNTLIAIEILVNLFVSPLIVLYLYAMLVDSSALEISTSYLSMYPPQTGLLSFLFSLKFQPVRHYCLLCESRVTIPCSQGVKHNLPYLTAQEASRYHLGTVPTSHGTRRNHGISVSYLQLFDMPHRVFLYDHRFWTTKVRFPRSTIRDRAVLELVTRSSRTALNERDSNLCG